MVVVGQVVPVAKAGQAAVAADMAAAAVDMAEAVEPPIKLLK